MAAPKTSLNPKARPRTKTEEKTLRGRPVWIDHTGEVTGEKGSKYSEVTTTIPWGTEWITAPSIDENGKRLSDDEVKQRLLRTRGKDFITGEELPTFSNPEKASEYAQWRSDTMFDQEAIEQGFPEEFPMGPEPKRKDFIDRSIDKGKDFLEYLTTPSKHGVFNKGGAVMNEQMEMAFMQQGGLKDDGMKRDPVSGNEVPNGSMAKEVRDDIPAQLSEGEYVVPADVVRYLGVKHFEDLRNKAKSGLQNMEANGRIGGEPVPVGGPQMADGGDLSPDEMNEIKMLMDQGGMVAGAAEGADFGQKFMTQPSVYGGGFSWEDTPGGTPSGVSIADPELPTETPESCELRGMVYNPETKMCEVPIETPPVGVSGGDGSSISDDEGEDSTTWMDSYDYTNFNNLAQQTSAALDGPTTMLGSAAEMIFGGGVLGKFAKASNAAQVAANIAVLKAQADTDPSLKGTVAELTTKFNNYVSSNNLGGLKNFITGKNLAKQINKTQVDVGLFEESTDVFGNKIFEDRDEFNKQLQDNAPAGMVYTPDQGAYIRPEGVSAAPDTSPRPEGGFAAAKAAATPVSKPATKKVPTSTVSPRPSYANPSQDPYRENRDSGPSGAEIAAARAQTPTAKASTGTKTTEEARAATASAVQKYGKATGGRATGGLVSRPKKKKK